MASQPARDLAQIALCHVLPDVPDFFLHFVQHLRAVSAAKGIGGEIADAAAAPMAVLEASLPVAGNIHAQIFLVQPLPLRRNVFDRQRPTDQLLFDLVAHHDVQAVGQLVGFGTDERRLRLVDGAVEHGFVHIRQLLREQLLQLRENGMDKGGTSADDVLIEPALALVNAHGHAAGQGGIIVAVVRPQLVQGVAALVDNGEHGGNQIVLEIMGGDAHILVIEIGGVGMLRLGNTAVGAVNAHDLHEIIGELSLNLHGIMAENESIVHLLRRPDFLDQGDDGLPELGEEGVQCLNVHSFLVLVQKRVVGRHFRVIIPGELPVIIHDLFQIGGKGGKIILQLCLVPYAFGVVNQHGIGNVFLRRDTANLVVALAQNLHLPLCLGTQFLGVGFQIAQKLVILIVHQQIIGNLGHDLHGLAPSLPGIAGRGGGGVQIQNAQGVVIRRLGLLQFLESLLRLLYGFIFHGNALLCFFDTPTISLPRFFVKRFPVFSGFREKNACIFSPYMLI